MIDQTTQDPIERLLFEFGRYFLENPQTHDDVRALRDQVIARCHQISYMPTFDDLYIILRNLLAVSMSKYGGEALIPDGEINFFIVELKHARDRRKLAFKTARKLRESLRELKPIRILNEEP